MIHVHWWLTGTGSRKVNNYGMCVKLESVLSDKVLYKHMLLFGAGTQYRSPHFIYIWKEGALQDTYLKLAAFSVGCRTSL